MSTKRLSGKSKGLDTAYALETPQDNIELYKTWATTYDDDFIASHNYIYPENMLDIFEAARTDTDTPILDIGAGTGIVGVILKKRGNYNVDALDISPEMLDVAASKQCYADTIVADLTTKLDIASNTYGALMSVGTFTLGHVGPEAFPELLRIAKTNALFCVGVNAQAFEKSDFGSAFEKMTLAGHITRPELHPVKYYADDATHEHKDDHGMVAVFRKL